jgi:hypothetical protein
MQFQRHGSLLFITKTLTNGVIRTVRITDKPASLNARRHVRSL